MTNPSSQKPHPSGHPDHLEAQEPQPGVVQDIHQHDPAGLPPIVQPDESDPALRGRPPMRAPAARPDDPAAEALATHDEPWAFLPRDNAPTLPSHQREPHPESSTVPRRTHRADTTIGLEEGGSGNYRYIAAPSGWVRDRKVAIDGANYEHILTDVDGVWIYRQM